MGPYHKVISIVLSTMVPYVKVILPQLRFGREHFRARAADQHVVGRRAALG